MARGCFHPLCVPLLRVHVPAGGRQVPRTGTHALCTLLATNRTTKSSHAHAFVAGRVRRHPSRYGCDVPIVCVAPCHLRTRCPCGAHSSCVRAFAGTLEEGRRTQAAKGQAVRASEGGSGVHARRAHVPEHAGADARLPPVVLDVREAVAACQSEAQATLTHGHAPHRVAAAGTRCWWTQWLAARAP